jgi:hypothetical protein
MWCRHRQRQSKKGERCRQREWVSKKHEEQNCTVKPEEARSEVCNSCSVVTETFGVLSLFGVTHCYSYSKIKSVIINCNSAWRISNQSSVKSRTHKLFFALPSKHVTIFTYIGLKWLYSMYIYILTANVDHATSIPHKTIQHNNSNNRHPGNKKEDKFVLKKE